MQMQLPPDPKFLFVEDKDRVRCHRQVGGTAFNVKCAVATRGLCLLWAID